MRETWVGKIRSLIVTKENSENDWVVVHLPHRSTRAPKWFALDLSHRTPTSMAIYNQLRDAKTAGSSVRLTVLRESRAKAWQEAIIVAVEDPALPRADFERFN